ncbi:NAD(P)-dependent oxidoreductase [Kushneria aurantia]|uniref:NAD(P)-dependent oxidoreductase n=1 Tax=Kushneria aurantia TaxID=504092 RepID=A0ABV6G6F1_9GAMM|nr:NAD(P)-dependent oxidoreductase [Kushneria aurantia]
MPLDLLVVTALSRRHQARIAEAGFNVHMAEDAERRASVIAEYGERIRAVLTIGTIGFSAEEMDALPRLGLICAQGVGHENIDLAAARARDIHVTHGPGTNAETVADHTFALMLASLRRIREGDAGLRAGEWQAIRRSAPNLHGATLGLLGMGAIARAIAHRAHYGFSMPVVYYSRSPKTELPWRHERDPLAVAQQADVLVAALPGGADTRHLVDARMLAALGERGTFINVGRGSVVESEALITALREKRIAGAGLDVFESEPEIPAAMKTLERLVMTPHTAGLSPQALDATIERVVDNLKAFDEGREMVTPVRG